MQTRRMRSGPPSMTRHHSLIKWSLQTIDSAICWIWIRNLLWRTLCAKLCRRQSFGRPYRRRIARWLFREINKRSESIRRVSRWPSALSSVSLLNIWFSSFVNVTRPFVCNLLWFVFIFNKPLNFVYQFQSIWRLVKSHIEVERETMDGLPESTNASSLDALVVNRCRQSLAVLGVASCTGSSGTPCCLHRVVC